MSQQNGGWGPPPNGGGYPPQGQGQPPPGYGSPPGGGYGPPGGFVPPGGYGGGGGFIPPGPTEISASVAWENPSLGAMSQWWGTLQKSALPSREFGAAVARSDNPMPAATFSLSMYGLFGLLAGVMVGVMYAVMGGVAAIGGTKGAGPAGAILASMGIGMAILYPLLFAFMGFVGPWISGGIFHLALMIMGGTSRPYTQTVRVCGYASGAIVWNLIPCVGGMAYFVISHVQIALGLDESHRCGLGKAVAAVFVPIGLLILCGCVGYITMFAAIMQTAGSIHP